jgi:hypothetical protein
MYIALATNNKEPQPKRHKWIPKIVVILFLSRQS